MRIDELDTPALIVDVDRMEANLQRAAAYARQHRLRLRPHTKTHKIPALAKRQLELGAAGLTVAKTTEAEVMLKARPAELLVAYPVLGAMKTERLVRLARETDLTVAVDSLTVARAIAAAAKTAGVRIGILVELDAGLHRVGVAGGEALRQIALSVLAASPALELRGIAFYPGHVKSADLIGAVTLRGVEPLLKEAIDTLQRVGCSPSVISGGSTPALGYSHWLPSMNEIRPGTYIFNDRNTVLSGACTWEDCAAYVVTTVVSTSVSGRAILDGGSKTFSSDRSAAPGFGRIVEAPDALFEKMNEEHGFIDDSHGTHKWKVGERVRVIPNHVCVAVNLHERIYGVKGEEVVETWEVEGRGKLQ
jgi:D-serine deaminase-like pyridoxal phosphate-dependent protein